MAQYITDNPVNSTTASVEPFLIKTHFTSNCYEIYSVFFTVYNVHFPSTRKKYQDTLGRHVTSERITNELFISNILPNIFFAKRSSKHGAVFIATLYMCFVLDDAIIVE